MRITLSTTTILTPLACAILPTAALAQTSITTATTSPVRTSTASSGSAGDVSVTSTGSITLNSGAAITVDSNNSVTNAGTLTQGNANGATGILISGGTSGTITNSGAISILETYVPSNDDGDTIVDGPIAQASGRAGIWANGAYTGNIVNSGTITLDGLNSAGIRVDGPLNGSLSSSGAITIIGDNSVGIQAGAVTGNVAIDGAISVVGEGASAIKLTGDVGGSVRIQNSVAQQASYTNDSSVIMTLSRSDLRVGAPAVAISGNVAGGIIIAIPPTISTTNTDVDGDGILDSAEGTGSIQSYGNGPALLIGGANNITISGLANDGHSLVVEGSVLSNAYYSNTNTAALVIGGQGGTVDLTGGIKVSGKIQATTVDSEATGILINAGSHVPVIDNSGSIIASITSAGEGAVYAIRDLSGTLTTINTTGFITASGSSTDFATSAIDVSANTSGVTINQSAPATTTTTTTSTTTTTTTTVTTQITGNIVTGAGNDLLNVSYGVVKGNSFLGAGDDRIALSGDAIYQGKADFGTGVGAMTLADTSQFIGTAIFNNMASTLTLSGSALFQGNITGGNNLSVNVTGGTLEAVGTSNVAFNSLTVGAGGTIKVAIDGETHTNPQFNVQSATFASGSHVAATLSSLGNVEGTYVVLTANQITGAPDATSTAADMPFLFNGAVNVDNSAGQVLLTITRKDAAELGLTRAQAAAYPAIIVAAPADASIQSSLLQVSDAATLQSQFNGLLPDHAGGNFDLLSRGSRMATRHLTNNNSMFDVSDVGGWLEVLKWGGSKDIGGTSSFKTSGFGVSGGLERKTGIGNVGVSIAWFSGSNKSDGGVSTVDSNAYELGAFWRVSHGPFYAFAKVSTAFASFNGARTFTGTIDSTDFTRTATGSWNGQLYAGTAGASYQVDAGERLSFKPMVILDYYRLHEKGYTETGAEQTDGGDAMDLVVAGRTSDAATATTTLTGIYRLGKRSSEGIPLTFELEAGRRNTIGGGLGSTTAHFVNGSDFTITPEAMKGGWLGELRVLSGGFDYTWTISGSAEQTAGSPSYAARISLGVAF